VFDTKNLIQFADFREKFSYSPNGDKIKEMTVEVLDFRSGYLYEILEEGLDIFKNKFFYQKAADVGDSSAAFRLGEIYLNWWFDNYYEHVRYNETFKAHNYLKLAEKCLNYAFKNREPDGAVVNF